MSGDEIFHGLHFFCAHRVDGGEDDVAELGHKGAHLARMRRLGLPVPPGFTLDVRSCDAVRARGALTGAEREALCAAVIHLEKEQNRRFGAGAPPLLLAVRAATRKSLPGLLPAVPNVGLTRAAAEAVDESAAAFMWSCYCRFLRDWGVHVASLPHEDFDYALEDLRERAALPPESDLDAARWRQAAELFEATLRQHEALPPPEPCAQLFTVVEALAMSWEAPRIVAERRMFDVPDEWGLALTVQAMAFGNLDERSAAGVALSRDPQTGEKLLSGEYLPRAQGEDIVAGLRTPLPVSEEERRRAGIDAPSLEEAMPRPFAALLKAVATLERHYRKPQNVEFVIESERLWLVQTLPARLGAQASLRVAVDMVREGLKTKREALADIDPYQVEKLLHPVLERSVGQTLLARGIGASPGAASGEVVIDPEEARRLAAAGRSVILVRPETTPEDIPALQAVRGVLTTRGGLTSHAAVIARGLGIPCVTGVGLLEIDPAAGVVRFGNREIRANEWITIDGASGEVFRGRMPTRQPVLSSAFHTVLEWADEVRRLRVRANADTPRDAEVALQFGAEGIGLCRTEHMFFGSERLQILQEIILSTDSAQRRKALADLVSQQTRDFHALFAVMAGRPVTIRLLDPPVHEFLPRTDAEIAAVARRLGTPPERLRTRVESLREYNPMLGHRGVRLAATFPELLHMQVRAAFQAMRALKEKGEAPSRLEIMVPFIMTPEEMRWAADQVATMADAVAESAAEEPVCSLGCMIELPAACERAGEIARHAAFFSFGTNDLTQTVLGLSRDDAGRFLHVYLEKGLLARNPFVTIDEKAVAPFIRTAIGRGRKARADLVTGACGEHAGDPASIAILAACGLDYVSCSPYRVPIARLAAAQAAIAAESA